MNNHGEKIAKNRYEETADTMKQPIHSNHDHDLLGSQVSPLLTAFQQTPILMIWEHMLSVGTQNGMQITVTDAVAEGLQITMEKGAFATSLILDFMEIGLGREITAIKSLVSGA